MEIFEVKQKKEIFCGDSARPLFQAINDLGRKWHFCEEGQSLVRASCLSRKPNWRQDIQMALRFFLSIICLLFSPIATSVFVNLANYGFDVTSTVSGMLSEQRCLIATSQPFQALANPPENCYSICQGLKDVPTVDTISNEEFLAHYAFSGRPLLVKGATRGWGALDTFSYQYFKSLFQPYAEKLKRYRASSDSSLDGVPLSGADRWDWNGCQFTAFDGRFDDMTDFFNMSDAWSRLELPEAGYYVGWNNCFREVVKELRKHYAFPSFLPVDSSASRVDWFFMGGSNKDKTGAQVHIDEIARPTWQAVVTGHKTWTIYSPGECDHVCPPQVRVDVSKGEMLIVDTTLWYHATQAEKGKITIAIGSEYD